MGQVRFDAPVELLERWAALKARKSELDRAAQARYLHDPVAWAWDRLGVMLWSKQDEIARSVVRNRRTAVRSAHGVGKCTTLTSMIPLADGTVREAKDLVGRCFVVQAWTEDGRQRPAIAWATDNDVKPVYRITTSSGRSIERTGNHPLYAATRVGGGSGKKLRVNPVGWTDVDQLAVDDLVLVPERLDIEGRQRAEERDVKLLGYLLGDGGTSARFVSFTQEDGASKDEFRKLIADYGCQTREHPANKYGIVVVGPDGERFGRKASNPVINRVRDWGLLGCKATEKRFPDWAWRLPNDQLALLLNRLFACDGWATVPTNVADRRRGANVSIAIGLANEGLIRDVELAMLRLGIVGTVRARTSAYDDSGRRFGSWDWTIRRLEDMRRFRDVVGILGKEDAVELAVATKEACGGRASHWMRSGAPEGYRWEQVTSVESLGEQPTVCISVPDYHTYLTTFVEHNSFTAAVLALWWVDVHPPGTAMVVSTAPSHEQVHAVLWEEIRRLHKRGALSGEVQRSDRWLDEQGRLVGLGRRPPDHAESAFQGIHRQFVLVILDEAGGIPAWLWTAAEAITTGEDCRMVAIGNPDDNSSEFARVCLRDQGWKTIRISAFDSPNLTGEPVPDTTARVLISREWVEDKRLRWGETNPLYLAKVLGEFADSEDGLVPLSWVTASQGRWRLWDDAGRPPQPGRLVLGVDVARYGEDKTCLAHRYGDVLARLDRHAKLDTTQTTSLVKAALHMQVKPVAVVDVIGIGAGVVDQCRAARLPVVAFNASAATRRRDSTGAWRFPNLRSAAFWNMRELLDPALNATVSLPPDDELAAELTVPTWAPAAGSMLRVEAKDSVRKRLGRSTDSADACVMAFWQERTWQTDEQGRARRPKVRRYADSVTWG